jgi:hypothetical protein
LIIYEWEREWRELLKFLPTVKKKKHRQFVKTKRGKTGGRLRKRKAASLRSSLHRKTSDSALGGNLHLINTP